MNPEAPNSQSRSSESLTIGRDRWKLGSLDPMRRREAVGAPGLAFETGDRTQHSASYRGRLLSENSLPKPCSAIKRLLPPSPVPKCVGPVAPTLTVIWNAQRDRAHPSTPSIPSRWRKRLHSAWNRIGFRSYDMLSTTMSLLIVFDHLVPVSKRYSASQFRRADENEP